ncbi:hypothetical protein FEM48_Zijuj05G0129000 [Ziziphus jujuba var. spinosa]|uniref:histone deacetylase n=1 Tax=Ziziphus jujuba var. spinosa TaxID=714518 RepID=A0A978VEY2_ZIZJJ|nr:hypothetical protein FEM48_Zijuj05G0129000 [Ziziphus jujuba var. spinosa]
MEVSDGEASSQRRLVGLLYDERMCKHHTPDGEPHPENPNRIRAIWNKLQSAGIHHRCVLFDAKEAEDKSILAVHSVNHVNLIKDISSNQYSEKARARIASMYNSIYFNEGSSEAAYLAAGSVIEVTEKVAKGELNSGVAIVRPPGHHAERDEAMGFCLFNNVAVATSYLFNEKPELGINRVLIVDWDVHHGNATQKMFWEDPRVLFFSVHRHEFGSFYPATEDGYYTKVGKGPGAGYNINVPWENGLCGDADYLAVWDHILIPVAKEFNPDIIIISAGFDAAIGDPLGGCRVTPYGYSVMLKKLLNFANGKIVLALEGGYNLESIANSMLACVKVLLEDNPIPGSSEAYPFESTWRVIQAVRQELSPFWPVLVDELPKKLISQTAPTVPYYLSSSSDSDVEENKGPDAVSENLEDVLRGVIEPLSKLKVGEDKMASNSMTWRSELSKIHIWYSSFGSNMWRPRFMCYIQGGQVEGLQRPLPGCMDKSPPKGTLWKILPYRLFFGRNFSRSWGPGGVAFINPEVNIHEKTYMCLYRITLEQFNDVLLQENDPSVTLSSPLFDLTALNSIMTGTSKSQEINMEKGWYRNVTYLGKVGDLPILTLTCRLSEVEGFRSGKIPLCPPGKSYTNILLRGLVEGKQLSEEEAIAYIQEAATKPL